MIECTSIRRSSEPNEARSIRGLPIVNRNRSKDMILILTTNRFARSNDLPILVSYFTSKYFIVCRRWFRFFKEERALNISSTVVATRRPD